MLALIQQLLEWTNMAMFCIIMLIQLHHLLGTLITGFLVQVITLNYTYIYICLYLQNPHVLYWWNCRGWIDSTKQFKDFTVASVQEETQQAGIPYTLVGSPSGHLHKPILVCLCFDKLGLQVGWFLCILWFGLSTTKWVKILMFPIFISQVQVILFVFLEWWMWRTEWLTECGLPHFPTTFYRVKRTSRSRPCCCCSI